jgi:hypothetical protein
MRREKKGMVSTMSAEGEEQERTKAPGKKKIKEERGM